jgi:putative addiction module component (TIGR02574 family)
MTATPLDKLTEQAMALPKPDRISLAQRLWESVEDADFPIYTDEELRAELRDRMRDEPDGTWKKHEEVMAEARRKFGCGK